MEPFGASGKGLELIASSCGIRAVDHLDYPEESSAEDGWSGARLELERCESRADGELVHASKTISDGVAGD
jgi:hypothetical protein